MNVNIDDWYTDENKPDPQNLPIPCGWRILIRPDSPTTKTAGGILIPIEKVERDRLVTNTGRVLLIGPLAWNKPEMARAIAPTPFPEAWCKVGDTVLFGKYAGVKVEAGGVRLVILNDDEIIAVVKKTT